MSFVSRLGRGVAAFALTAALAGPALAATDEEITAALVAALEEGGATNVRYDGPERSGNTLTYANLSFATEQTSPDAPPTESEVVIESLSLTDADIPEAGAFSASSTEARGITIDGDDTVVTIATLSASGIEFLPPQEGFNRNGRYDDVRVSDIVVQREGQSVVTIAGVSIVNENFLDMLPRKFTMRADSITFDPSNAPDGAEAAAQLQAVGYETLTFDFALDGTWDDAAETARLDTFRLAGTDIGTLEISLTLAGVSKEVFEDLQKTEPSFESISELAVSDIALRFEDASITGRVLEMQAKEMGTDAAGLAEQLSAALPLLLSPLQNPAFQAKLAGAAGAFLKNQRSITLTAKPAEPVSVIAIMGTAETAPQTLPDLLNVDVAAD